MTDHTDSYSPLDNLKLLGLILALFLGLVVMAVVLWPLWLSGGGRDRVREEDSARRIKILEDTREAQEAAMQVKSGQSMDEVVEALSRQLAQGTPKPSSNPMWAVPEDADDGPADETEPQSSEAEGEDGGGGGSEDPAGDSGAQDEAKDQSAPQAGARSGEQVDQSEGVQAQSTEGQQENSTGLAEPGEGEAGGSEMTEEPSTGE